MELCSSPSGTGRSRNTFTGLRSFHSLHPTLYYASPSATRNFFPDSENAKTLSKSRITKIRHRGLTNKLMNEHIEQAIEIFRKNAVRYARTERYYNGRHDLAFATEKFQNAFGSLFREFAMNLCPAICDAVRDKLRITGFSVDEVGKSNAFTREAKNFTPEGVTLTKDISRIWNDNAMRTRAGELHKEAVKNGDAYAIVWPNERGEVTIYPNSAASSTVVYDEESPGKIRWAAKYWKTGTKHTRINLFYPDRIEKYISAKTGEMWLPDAKEFIECGSRNAECGNEENPPAAMSGSRTVWDKKIPNSALRIPQSPIPNPYGVVPVFHFANNADVGRCGISELEAAIPVQDGLNKSVLDMLVAMEFCAYRQRWAAGIEIEYDADGKPKEPFVAGIDHLWITQNPDARFGDFEAANLDQFLKVKDSFRIDMASVTGTPLYYLMPHTKGFPSGESLRKAETRFLAKVRDRQQSFGQVWAALMSFALMATGRGQGIRLITDWEDPAPTEEREFLQNILLKKRIGISDEQALREAGYGDADVERMVGGRQ